MDCLEMGDATLHCGIVVEWFEIMLLYHFLTYYGRQWDFIWCNHTFNLICPVCKRVQLLGVCNRKELCNIGKYLNTALYTPYI